MPYTIQPTTLKYKNGNVFMSADCLKGDPGGADCIVTPEQFGAVGDGVADDTQAIQDAIDHGGLIVCSKVYRITGDIYLRNPEVSGDISTYPRSRIVGRSGITALMASNTPISYLQPNQATFYHDGGRFCYKYTASVEFSYCVFMGNKEHTKTDIAFYAPESPYRRLHIDHCTFSNFDCAIYGYQAADENVWSGENIFDTLYFTHCNYCICLENGGYDSIFTNMIAQGSCGYFLRLTEASVAMIRGNHDYSQNGCVIYSAANITGNYFDGIDKLHIQGGTGSGVRSAKFGPVITGNMFLVASSVTGRKWIIAVDDYLFGAVICDNRVVGGDNAIIDFFNLANANYFNQNIVRNNTGNVAYFTTAEETATISIYGNDFDRYKLYADVGNGTVNYEKYYWGTKCSTFYGSYESPDKFIFRGTEVDGIYSDVFSKINVTLTNNTEDSAIYTDDGSSLNSSINNKWGFANIAKLDVEIHINFGRFPLEAEPRVRDENSIPISIPTAPDFSDDEET